VSGSVRCAKLETGRITKEAQHHKMADDKIKDDKATERLTGEQSPDAADLEEVLASIDPTPVQMARDYLQSAGIEAFIFDDESSRMLGSTAAVPARLMVHADAAAEARKRLEELGFIETGSTEK
jgi:hypothetical protein